MDKTTTLQSISAWPIDDQIDLVQQVWQGIVTSGWQPKLSEEQRAELDRRSFEMDNDPSKVISRSEFERAVRSSK